MLHKEKRFTLYLDTSVISGILDDEFKDASIHLFKLIKDEIYTGYYSEVSQTEINKAPNKIKDNVGANLMLLKYLPTIEETLQLSSIYLSDKIISEKFYLDALHVAIATVNNLDAIVSWNFKHIVNLRRIRLFNSTNYREGYKRIEIITPMEVIYGEF